MGCFEYLDPDAAFTNIRALGVLNGEPDDQLQAADIQCGGTYYATAIGRSDESRPDHLYNRIEHFAIEAHHVEHGRVYGYVLERSMILNHRAGAQINIGLAAIRVRGSNPRDDKLGISDY